MTTRRTIRISSPAELLSAMPYLIGHHIAESYVIVALSQREIVFSARSDLSVAPAEVAHHVRTALADFPPGLGLIVIGYTESGDGSRIRDLAAALARGRHPVEEVLRVTGGRFFCLADDGCTPPDGSPLETATPAAAELVLGGVAPLPSRASVDDMMAPVTGDRASQMMQAFQRAARRLMRSRLRLPDAQSAIDKAFALAQQGQTLPDDDAAWLCLVLHDLNIRDVAWLRTDSEQWQFNLWLDLTQRCLPAAVAPVASLLAWNAWRRGDGATAKAALGRALSVEPEYCLANLVFAAQVHGIPPHTIGNWPPADADLPQT